MLAEPCEVLTEQVGVQMMTDEEKVSYERSIEALVSKLSDALDRNMRLIIQLTEAKKRIRELELENERLGGQNRRIRLEGDDP